MLIKQATRSSTIYRTVVPAEVAESAKLSAILTMLRSKIIDGTYPPASRIPTREEFRDSLNVSISTVQRALEILGNEGFVVSRGRAGTTVAQYPPHLYNYGLVFPSHPTEDGSPNRLWSHFYDAMRYEVQHLEKLDESKRFQFFYDVNSHADNQSHQALVKASRSRRFKGLIFLGPLTNLMGSPILEMPEVGKVAAKSIYYSSIPGVTLDSRMFLDRALDWLHERGRKRVALLTGGSFLFPTVPTNELPHYFASAAAKRSMTSHPWWTLILDPMMREGTRQVIELLMRSSGDQRPDSVILTDDYFTEPATAGLLAAGLRMPADLDVVAYCNFPLPMRSLSPVKYLGLDARRMLQTFVDVIDKQYQGEQVPEVTYVPASFDHECTVASPQQA